MLVVCLPSSRVLYLSSEPGKSYMNVPLSALSQRAIVEINFRVVSFMGLTVGISLLALRIPDIVLWFERRKGKIRAIIASKKNIALVLGALSVGTAIGTALLQFIQVVSSLFHL
jgi:hypothetical protein